MAKYQMVVLAKAADGRVDELGHWYGTQHLPDLLRTPGFAAGTVHSIKTIGKPAGAPGWDFLAVYDLDTDDPMTVLAEAGRRMGTERMPRSDALESISTVSLIATPVVTKVSEGWT